MYGRVNSVGKMGVIQGGGQWPNRLVQRCREIVGELGEDVIYDIYVQANESDHRQVEKPEEEYALMFRYARHIATQQTDGMQLLPGAGA